MEGKIQTSTARSDARPPDGTHRAQGWVRVFPKRLVSKLAHQREGRRQMGGPKPADLSNRPPV